MTILFSINCNSQSMKNDDFIVGSWLLVNSQGLNCNVCPEIEFAKNGTGKITRPSKEEIGFTFALSSDNKIAFSFKKDQGYFDEKEFDYKVYTENHLEILELNSINGDSKYILSREKL